MNIDPDGYFFFSFLIGMAVSSLVMWGIGEIFGSQVAGGIGSLMSGYGAITTGIALCAFGPIGIALGIGLMAADGFQAISGVSDLSSVAFGVDFMANENICKIYDSIYTKCNAMKSIKSRWGVYLDSYQRST